LEILGAYVTGNRPQKVELLKANSDSPLVIGAKIDEKTGLAELGEFRAEGGMGNRAIARLHRLYNHEIWQNSRSLRVLPGQQLS
jgi:hypothetical protein